MLATLTTRRAFSSERETRLRNIVQRLRWRQKHDGLATTALSLYMFYRVSEDRLAVVRIKAVCRGRACVVDSGCDYSQCSQNANDRGNFCHHGTYSIEMMDKQAGTLQRTFSAVGVGWG